MWGFNGDGKINSFFLKIYSSFKLLNLCVIHINFYYPFYINYYRSLSVLSVVREKHEVVNTHNTRRLLTADKPFRRSIGKSITGNSGHRSNVSV